MDITSAIIIGVIFSFIFLVVGLPVLLYHRREMIRMKGLSDKSTEKLINRISALEQHYSKLDASINEVHLLLADEQRQMDKKLMAILPDTLSKENEEVKYNKVAALVKG